MLSRLALAPPMMTATLVRSTLRQIPKRPSETLIIRRQFQRDSREGFQTRSERITEKKSLRERAMAPVGPNAYGIGRGAVAGGAALGLGALAFYGLGLGKGTSVLDNSHLWPQYVRDRIHSTYQYFGGSVLITAASAAAVFRSPALLNLVARNGWIPMLATFALMIGSGMVARAIPYEKGLGTKQLAWATHCAIMGAIIAPLCFVGGPILMRAAWYTAGIVGGLSTVAVCAPSDKFLYMGGPLAIGLGFVFASSLAGMFLPPTTVLGAGLYSISLYGGLLLFSGFLLYDTQRIVRMAEMHPPNYVTKFDPVNAAISIYMDTLNIFIRIVSIMAGGGNRRK